MKKIQIEAPGNPICRVFNTNFRLSEHKATNFWFPLDQGSDQYLNRVGVAGRCLVRRFNQIDGITEVTLQLYKLRVEIGAAFQWKEIIEQVTAAIGEVYARDESYEIDATALTS